MTMRCGGQETGRHTRKWKDDTALADLGAAAGGTGLGGPLGHCPGCSKLEILMMHPGGDNEQALCANLGTREVWLQIETGAPSACSWCFEPRDTMRSPRGCR